MIPARSCSKPTQIPGAGEEAAAAGAAQVGPVVKVDPVARVADREVAAARIATDKVKAPPMLC